MLLFSKVLSEVDVLFKPACGNLLLLDVSSCDLLIFFETNPINKDILLFEVSLYSFPSSANAAYATKTVCVINYTVLYVTGFWKTYTVYTQETYVYVATK